MARVYNIPTGPDADAEVLTVSSDELPPDANEVLDIIREFTTETWTPPLATYCDLAAEYTRRGLHVEAGKVLRAGLDPKLAKFVTDQAVGDPNFESRSRLLCSYASLCLLHPMATGVALSPDQRLARAEAMMKVFREFVKAYDKSPLASAVSGAMHLFRAAHLASGSERDAAMNAVAMVARAARVAAAASGTGDSLPVLMFEGAAQYYARDYVAARASFARVITLNPRCPAGVRVALGQCLWQLGYAEAAAKAFTRALALEPGHALARSLLAQLQMSSCVREGTNARKDAVVSQAVELLKTAFASVAADGVAGGAASVAASTAAPTAIDSASTLALARVTLAHWQLLTGGGGGSGGDDGAAVPVAVTRGSRHAVLLAPELSPAQQHLIWPGACLRVRTFAQTAPVPARLVREGALHASRVSASALPPAILAAHPHLGPLGDATVVVLTLRAPWMLRSDGSASIEGIDAPRAARLARSVVAAEAADAQRARSTAEPGAAAGGGGSAAQARSRLLATAQYTLACALHLQGAYAEAGNYYRHALEAAAAASQQLQAAAGTSSSSVGGGGGASAASTAASTAAAASSLAVAARYGLALTLAAAGKGREAQADLRLVLASRPEDRSAQRSLAALLASTGAVAEAQEHARRAMDAGPSDAAAAALCASLAAQGEGRASLERCSAACVSAMMRLRGAGCWIPPALLCNLGVVALRRAGLEAPSDRAPLFAESRKFFEFALTALASESAPGADTASLKTAASIEAAMLSQQGVTVAYNIARLAEAEGKADEAAELYRRITQAHPGYLDAYLRLAVIAQSLGDSAGARGWCDRCIHAASDHHGAAAIGRLPQATTSLANAYILAGQISEASGDAAGARALYQAAVDFTASSAAPSQPSAAAAGGAAAAAAPAAPPAAASGDLYALLSLANLTFRELYSLPAAAAAAASSSKDSAAAAVADPSAGARESLLRRSFAAYKDVLKRDPANVFGANGLGMVLAEQGKLEDARAVFSLLREAAQDAGPPTVNLAHTLVALHQHAAAVQLYSRVCRRCGSAATSGTPGNLTVLGGGATGAGRDVARLLRYAARAHTETGAFAAAIPLLAKAVAEDPADCAHRFNLAYAQGAEGFRVLRLDASQRTPEQVEDAAELMRAALAGFHWLRALHAPSSAADGGAPPITGSGVAPLPPDGLVKLAQFIAHLTAHLPTAEAHISDARMRAAKAAAAARERSQQLQQRSEAKAAAEADVEAEKRAVRERAEATARSLRERMAARTAEFTSSGSNAAAGRAAREVGRHERASFDPGEDLGGSDDDLRDAAEEDAVLRELFGEGEAEELGEDVMMRDPAAPPRPPKPAAAAAPSAAAAPKRPRARLSKPGGGKVAGGGGGRGAAAERAPRVSQKQLRQQRREAMLAAAGQRGAAGGASSPSDASSSSSSGDAASSSGSSSGSDSGSGDSDSGSDDDAPAAAAAAEEGGGENPRAEESKRPRLDQAAAAAHEPAAADAAADDGMAGESEL